MLAKKLPSSLAATYLCILQVAPTAVGQPVRPGSLAPAVGWRRLDENRPGQPCRAKLDKKTLDEQATGASAWVPKLGWQLMCCRHITPSRAGHAQPRPARPSHQVSLNPQP